MRSRLALQAGGLVALLIAATFFLSGCASCKPGKLGDPQAYNLQFKLSDTLRDSSVVVDIIPANPADLERLKTYSINKYWRAGDPLRQDLSKTTFSFVSGDSLERTFLAGDAKWKQWKKMGIQYLVVIADLPGVFDDEKIGSQDPRRQLLPICECYWQPKTEVIPIEIQPSGVRPTAVPRQGQTLPSGW